jgi:hypothetical protein
MFNISSSIGMQCLPYPVNRLPGWHRRSAALHLDDRRIYFEDSEGGREYKDDAQTYCIPKICVEKGQETVTLGCGYRFNHDGGVGSLFYTYDGKLLPVAFHGIFDAKKNKPHEAVDVFAAVGVTDGPCHFDVNFGAKEFRWTGPTPSQEGVWNHEQWNPDEWNVRGLLDRLGDAPPEYIK